LTEHTASRAEKVPAPVQNTAAGLAPKRDCRCGSAAGLDGMCAGCRSSRLTLQRSALSEGGPSVAPPIVHDVLRSPGRPLEPKTREFMEARFGHDFSHVRVHTDARAAQSAQAVNANAYTVGRDIVFGGGRFQPQNSLGKHLLAHELTHVVQQSNVSKLSALKMSQPNEKSEKEADNLAKRTLSPSPVKISPVPLTAMKLQRQTIPGGGATPGPGEGLDLIFIVRAPESDEYTRSMELYIRTVLQGQVYEKIDNLDDLFRYLSKLNPDQQKIRRIRLVSHGHKTSGGVALIPPGKKKKRWFTPKEITEYSRRPEIRDLVKSVMAPQAVVEFWGCNIGKSQLAGKAWANLFQSRFSATTATLKTEFDHYLLPAKKGEKGFHVKGKKGPFRQVKHTSELDELSDEEKMKFQEWLQDLYWFLVENGDLPNVDRSYEEMMEYMIELFNRSNGDIRALAIETSKGNVIGPGNQDEWKRVWVTFEPISIVEAIEGNDRRAVAEVPTVPPPNKAQMAHSQNVTGPTEADQIANVSSTTQAQQTDALWMMGGDEKFLVVVAKALDRSSNDLSDPEAESGDLLNQMRWGLFLAISSKQQGNIPEEHITKLAYLWAGHLNQWTTDQDEDTIRKLSDAVIKLSLEEIRNIHKTQLQIIKVAPGSISANEKSVKPEEKAFEVQLKNTLAQLKEEEIIFLDKFQEHWDAITGSNTQQLINFIVGKAANKIANRLPRLGDRLNRLTKLWVIRHAGTLFLDITRLNMGDELSARRMMFFDTKETIEIYNFLIRHWSQKEVRKKRPVEVIQTGSRIGFQGPEERITKPEMGDRLRGLTLEKFANLYLSDKETAFRVADIVGSYVWENSPRMGTSAGREAVRRIDEGVKLFRDGLSAAYDIYALFNPIWNVIQTVVAVGEIFNGKP
jgi:hypothetical protein